MVPASSRPRRVGAYRVMVVLPLRNLRFTAGSAGSRSGGEQAPVGPSVGHFARCAQSLLHTPASGEGIAGMPWRDSEIGSGGGRLAVFDRLGAPAELSGNSST